MEAKLIKIGNSKGIRLPNKLIKKYHLNDNLKLIEKDEGILIKPDAQDDKLSWEDTFKEMGKEKEDWSDFSVTLGDVIE